MSTLAAGSIESPMGLQLTILSRPSTTSAVPVTATPQRKPLIHSSLRLAPSRVMPRSSTPKARFQYHPAMRDPPRRSAPTDQRDFPAGRRAPEVTRRRRPGDRRPPGVRGRRPRRARRSAAASAARCAQSTEGSGLYLESFRPSLVAQPSSPEGDAAVDDPAPRRTRTAATPVRSVPGRSSLVVSQPGRGGPGLVVGLLAVEDQDVAPVPRRDVPDAAGAPWDRLG